MLSALELSKSCHLATIVVQPSPTTKEGRVVFFVWVTTGRGIAGLTMCHCW